MCYSIYLARYRRNPVILRDKVPLYWYFSYLDCLKFVWQRVFAGRNPTLLSFTALNGTPTTYPYQGTLPLASSLHDPPPQSRWHCTLKYKVHKQWRWTHRELWYGRIDHRVYNVVFRQHHGVWRRCRDGQVRGSLMCREAGRWRRWRWNANIRRVLHMTARISRSQFLMQLHMVKAHHTIVSDIAVFVLKRDVKLQLTHSHITPFQHVVLHLCFSPFGNPVADEEKISPVGYFFRDRSQCFLLPSVLWLCWLGDTNGIKPIKYLSCILQKVLFLNK